MSVVSPAIATSPLTPPAEQRFVLHGVDWKTYCVLRELMDSPGLRMTYLHGELELMSPSPRHESLKKTIARLVEVFALERDVPLYAYGSTTFRHEARERGLEPDECYCVGHKLAEYPDIAIEVALTSGGIDKLDVYAGLGVREVWFWMDGRLRVYVLGTDGYAEVSASGLIPTLDLVLLARYAAREDQHEAVREYRDALRRMP